jgi:hypothetical protein
MTSQRVLPAVSLPDPGLPHPRGAAAPARPTLLPPGAVRTERAARPVTARPARREALLTTPARAGMLIGVSAAIYAVSLATVSGLQYQSEADLASQHQPMLETIAQARAANDALEATVMAADARAQALAADYAAAGGDVAAYQAKLDDLAKLVAKVRGSAAALSTRINLPSVSVHGAIGGGSVRSSGGSAPATGGTTAASGKP